MKYKLIPILLCLVLLLTGCAGFRAGTQAAAAETEPPAHLPALQPEPGAPAAVPAVSTRTLPETEAPETEPVPELPEADPGLKGTVMEVPERLTANPEQPKVTLIVRFPETDLTGAPRGRVCSLECKQNGRLIAQISDFRLLPGARARFTVPFTFTRYMETETSLTVVLRCGDQVLTAETAVQLENYPDEVYARATGDPRPYSIDILRNHNVVVIYGKDDAGDYTVPVHVYVCSTGRATPTGWYSIGDKHVWGGLFGGVYGQYLSRITGNILFHSVPYYSMRKDRIETEEYNKLGTAASMGCIRLPVRDAKWIYENCPTGTKVHIYDIAELPVEKPESIRMDPSDPRSGWDPTDPDPENPWLAGD